MISSSSCCSCCIWTKHTHKNPVFSATLCPRGQAPLPNYTILLVSSSNITWTEQPLKGLELSGRKASICQFPWAREQSNLKPLFRFNTSLPEKSHIEWDQHFPLSYCLSISRMPAFIILYLLYYIKTILQRCQLIIEYNFLHLQARQIV